MKRNGFLRYENGALAMLGVTFGLVYFDRMAIIFLMPFVAPELQLSNTQVGMVTSALALAWAVSGYLLGAYSDRTSNRKGILVLLVVAFSVCTILTGAVTSFLTLLIVRAVMGFSEGPILPIAQSIMAQVSTPSRRGFNMGVLQSVPGAILSGILGPIITVALASAFGWRQAMYIVGVPGLLMAAILWRYLRRPEPPAASTQRAGEAGLSRMPLKSLLGYRNIWLGVVIGSGMLAWLFTLLSFAPLYLVQVRRLAPEQMGLVMAATGVGSLAWGVVVPMLSDRLGRKPITVLSCLLSALTPLLIVHLPVPAPMLALALACGFMGAGCLPVIVATIPSETVPAGYAATAIGLIIGSAEVFGGVIAPTLAGVAADAAGMALPFYISAGGAVVAGLLALLLIETAPSKVSPAGAVPFLAGVTPQR